MMLKIFVDNGNIWHLLYWNCLLDFSPTNSNNGISVAGICNFWYLSNYQNEKSKLNVILKNKWPAKNLIYIDIYRYIYHHHHHVVPLAPIPLTLNRHFSQSFIASSRYSGLHPVSSQTCCMYVRAGRPAFAWPYAGVHRSTSLMSSSLLLQQCPACKVRLTLIVFVMGGRWPYSWCLVGCLPPGLVQYCSQHFCWRIYIYIYIYM